MTTDDLERAVAFAAATEHEGDPRVMFAQAKAACRALANEIERLDEIVNRLPRDAEGNPIAPGQRLYFALDDVQWEATSVMCLDQDEAQHAPLEAMTWSMWHTSPEAAEKARNQ